MRKPAELVPQPNTISVVDAFDLPKGSKATFSESRHAVRRDNKTIQDKRIQAQRMREMGVSEATIRRRGLDEATLRHAEKRIAARAAEREGVARRIVANRRIMKEAGVQYETVRRQGHNHNYQRRTRLLPFEKALAKIKSPSFFQRQVRQRLIGHDDNTAAGQAKRAHRLFRRP